MSDQILTTRAKSTNKTLKDLIDDILDETTLTYTNEAQKIPVSRSLNDNNMDDEDTVFKCLKRICKETLLVIIFKNNGNVLAKNWMDDIDATDFDDWAFDDFVENSFQGSYEITPKDTYNTFKFVFGWNPYLDNYEYQVKINNPGADSYDSSYTPGFLDRSGGIAEKCWNLCHDAYLRTNNINEFELEMKWHDETGEYDTISPVSTQEYLIYQIVRWLTMPRRIVKFSYPLKDDTQYFYDAELMDRVTVNHPVYTNGDEQGWIVKKRVDILKGKIDFDVIMQPANWADTEYNIIIENGERDDTIGETGSRTDQYDERGIS